MLNESGVEAHIEHAIDNNCIDRLVTQHKPTHVIIEAYWVVPEKFEILTRLHSGVKWIIRNHSELPFLASEGMAIDWTVRYVQYPNVVVSGNSPRVLAEMRTIIKHSYPEWSWEEVEGKVWFLSNFYRAYGRERQEGLPDSEFINVGCFGAIRPLKNHLLQAVAAMKFAERVGKKLRFHINATRVEGNANAALNNLRKLFGHATASGHQLVEHGWLDHKKFVAMLRHQIDIGMCVSHSETFCIVAADLVTSGVPVVASEEVPWLYCLSQAEPNSSRDIANHLHTAWKYRGWGILQALNLWGLRRYNAATRRCWLRYFN
jgi:hypothetical protein